MKEKADHLQGLKGLRSISPLVFSSLTLNLNTVSKFEEGKERLYMRYEQQRKKEKTMISEQERFCTEKLAQLEESLNK
ncbi:BnaA05g09850D [Brassica napus]|uniref:BnaA05g09850D protein n=2 Tax=Brassica napus TaxID=3708 RepID=A0A078FXX1_BRANA|nr:BnaA05g09850D [Brassica napus]